MNTADLNAVAPTAPAAPAVAAPTTAFVGASWVALLLGMTGFLTGLFNASMDLSEKGFYLTLLLFGLFGAVSVQKSVRDRAEGIEVSALYLGLSWAAVGVSLSLLSIGLWNAELARSEKGFYAMAFGLAMYAAVAVQKNVRDLAVGNRTAARSSSGASASIGAGETGPADNPLRWRLGS